MPSRPSGGPEQVLAYLSRYTHRVAIANSRLLSIAGDLVAFRWKDYRDNGTTKVMTLAAHKFIRRFLLHTLPDGFHRQRSRCSGAHPSLRHLANRPSPSQAGALPQA